MSRQATEKGPEKKEDVEKRQKASRASPQRFVDKRDRYDAFNVTPLAAACPLFSLGCGKDMKKETMVACGRWPCVESQMMISRERKIRRVSERDISQT